MDRLSCAGVAGYDAQIHEAITGVCDSTYASRYAAAAALDLPISTVYDRLQLKPTCAAARGKQQNWSPAEGKSLKWCIERCGRTGYPLHGTGLE